MANTLRFKRGLASGIPTALAGEPLFTTDTFDLYIGNGTTNTRFQKYIASGATTQILRGDGSLYTFPLAISSPSNGQVLKYNGTSWVNDSDSGITGSLTTNYLPKATGATTLGNSNVINDASGSLLLGITSVTYGATGKFINRTSGTSDVGLALNGGAWSIASIGGEPAFYLSSNIVAATGVGGSTETARGGMGFEYSNSSAPTDLVLGIFGTPTVTSSVRFFNSSERMRLTTLGNLHIGTFSSDSGEKLQVTGTMKVTGASSFGGTISLSGNANTFVVGSILRNANRIFFCGDTGGYYWQNSNNSATILQLTDSGNLGLGVTPSAWASLKAFQINSQSSLSADGTSTQLSTNAFFDGAWKYIQTDEATNYYQLNGQHVWRTAISGSANAAITWNQAMTLDASGNLGVGTASPSNRLHVYGTDGFSYVRWTSDVATTGTRIGYNGTEFRIDQQQNAAVTIRTNSTEALRVTPLQNLHIGTFSSDSGEKLQVTGTAKITGATTFGGNLTVGDTTTGRNVNIYSSSYGSNGLFQAFGTDGALKLQMGGLGTNTAFLYTGAGNAMQFFSGNAVALTLASNQAATFTGNLTVDTNTLFVDATNNRVGIGTTSPARALHVLSGVGTAQIQSSGTTSHMYFGDANSTVIDNQGIGSVGNNLWFSAGGLERMRITSGGDVGIGMTPSYKLDVSGSARVSDAIAIGTTPDTNNPFKILKNINATVGIKFENTNTSSSAFSAVQLGTDVSGGTKFTNLVYASSGVTASGVYNPDGTSLINNGNGGLNFLGNPIRMYTGGSNGVLRWDLVNDGYITHYSATAPTTSATDSYRQYSADVTAGNAAPHFRTENGAVIKLYQETTAVGNSTISVGGGNAVLDDTEFDGYTLRQIVKALRNQGILA
jgi:hypothetical protein